jgi:hypothetical protein
MSKTSGAINTSPPFCRLEYGICERFKNVKVFLQEGAEPDRLVDTIQSSPGGKDVSYRPPSPPMGFVESDAVPPKLPVAAEPLSAADPTKDARLGTLIGVERSLEGATSAAEGLDALSADGLSVQEDDAKTVNDVLGEYLETRAGSSEAVNAFEGNDVVAQETAEYGSEPNEVGEQTTVESLSEATHGSTVSERGSSESNAASQRDEPSTSEPAPTSPLLAPSSSDHAPPSQVPESTPPEPAILPPPSPVDPIEAARWNWELFKPPEVIDLRSRVRKARSTAEERPAAGTAKVSADVSDAADVMEAGDVTDAVGEPLPGADAKQGAPEQDADVMEAADGLLPGETLAEGAGALSADVMEAADEGLASSSSSESGSDVRQAGDEVLDGTAAVLDAPERGAVVMKKAGEAIHGGPEPVAEATDGGEFPPRSSAVSEDADDVADALRRDVGQGDVLPVEEVDEGVSVRGPSDESAQVLGAAERKSAEVVFCESQPDDGQSGGESTGQISKGGDVAAFSGPSSGAREASRDKGVLGLEGTYKERGIEAEDEVVAAESTLKVASSDGDGENGSVRKRSREAHAYASRLVVRAFGSDDNESIAASLGLKGGFYDDGNEWQESQESLVTGSPSEGDSTDEGVVAGPASIGASTNEEAEGITAGSSLEGASSDEEGGTETEVEDGAAGSGLEVGSADEDTTAGSKLEGASSDGEGGTETEVEDGPAGSSLEVGSTDEEGEAEADLLREGETDAEQWERNVMLCRWRMFNHEVAVLVGGAAEEGEALTVEVGCSTL